MAAPAITQTDLSAPAGVGRASMVFYINLATLTDAVQLVHTPGFKGRLAKTTFVTHIPATTAAKLSTLTPSIAGVDVTGGVLALTTVSCDTRGEVKDGTAITALNAFTATQSLTITGSGTTAFAEGSGWLVLDLINDDTVNSAGRAEGGLRTANP